MQKWGLFVDDAKKSCYQGKSEDGKKGGIRSSGFSRAENIPDIIFGEMELGHPTYRAGNLKKARRPVETGITQGPFARLRSTAGGV